MTTWVSTGGEYDLEMAKFVEYWLNKNGIKTEIRPLLGSSKDSYAERSGIADPFPGWNPTHVIMVPEKDLKNAEYILQRLPEYNWYKKRPKVVDISSDIIPQMYGIKPFKKKNK